MLGLLYAYQNSEARVLIIGRNKTLHMSTTCNKLMEGRKSCFFVQISLLSNRITKKIKQWLSNKYTNYEKYLDIPSTYHNSIHLIKCQLRSFRELIFHKCKTFVFLRNWIPAHINGLNRSKRNESLSYCIFFELKTNTPNINSKIERTIFINIQILSMHIQLNMMFNTHNTKEKHYFSPEQKSIQNWLICYDLNLLFKHIFNNVMSLYTQFLTHPSG